VLVLTEMAARDSGDATAATDVMRHKKIAKFSQLRGGDVFVSPPTFQEQMRDVHGLED
jgi:hypothetical protein